MNLDLQAIILVVSIANGLGIGKILFWVLTVEKRITAIETGCEIRHRVVDAEGR